MPSRPKKRGLRSIGWGKKCGMHQTKPLIPQTMSLTLFASRKRVMDYLSLSRPVKRGEMHLICSSLFPTMSPFSPRTPLSWLLVIIMHRTAPDEIVAILAVG
jgi:hypothetical protein